VIARKSAAVAAKPLDAFVTYDERQAAVSSASTMRKPVAP